MIKINNDIYKNYVVQKVGFCLTNTLILLFFIVLLFLFIWVNYYFVKNKILIDLN